MMSLADKQSNVGGRQTGPLSGAAVSLNSDHAHPDSATAVDQGGKAQGPFY